MLEVWHEIKVELEQENIRPVSPDVDNMMEITRILNDRAAGVSTTQVCLREEREMRNRGRVNLNSLPASILCKLASLSSFRYASGVTCTFTSRLA